MTIIFYTCLYDMNVFYMTCDTLINYLNFELEPNDSAVFQLIDINGTILKAVDEGKEVRAVFCDISKASTEFGTGDFF